MKKLELTNVELNCENICDCACPACDECASRDCYVVASGKLLESERLYIEDTPVQSGYTLINECKNCGAVLSQ